MLVLPALGDAVVELQMLRCPVVGEVVDDDPKLAAALLVLLGVAGVSCLDAMIMNSGVSSMDE